MARTVHMAAKVNEAGGVSALCYIRPKAIDLNKATWTLSEEAVTCAKCNALLADRRALRNAKEV